MKHLEGAESSLVQEQCSPCEKSTLLSTNEVSTLLQAIERGWSVIDGHHLKRRFKFRTFQEALEFTNRVGAIAEVENHHPIITVGWGQADVVIYTHTLDGLSRNDFILASKISSIVRQTYQRNDYPATD